MKIQLLQAIAKAWYSFSKTYMDQKHLPTTNPDLQQQKSFAEIYFSTGTYN